MKVGVFGKGRLGAAIAQAAGPALMWQVTRDDPPDWDVDVVIEASVGAAVERRLAWALAHEVPLVIGTTGWSIPDLHERVGARIGVVLAPNFSLGVALVRRLAAVLGRWAALDPARDPYLWEHHHARKHDAPSGTATMLAATLLAHCPRKTTWAQGGPLSPEQLSVGVLRAGSTYSAHTVGVDAPGEVIEVRHEARSALPFGEGALVAARWVRDRRGVFTMDDVAGDVLDRIVGLEPAPRAPEQAAGAAGAAPEEEGT